MKPLDVKMYRNWSAVAGDVGEVLQGSYIPAVVGEKG